jgi:hypothetical protein
MFGSWRDGCGERTRKRMMRVKIKSNNRDIAI